MPFLTRPHFEDRQIVQYGEDSIQLSGLTKIAPTILNYVGSTTGETTVTINNITGYLNGQRPYGLKVEPAKVTISGTTGTTTQNVTGFVLKSADPYGSVEWAPISGISFSLSACTSPLYTEIIEACGGPTRPIYVTAGRVEFDNGSGSPKTVINTNLGSLGIGTGISPSERLHVSGGDMLVETSNGKFYTDLDDSVGAVTKLSGGTSSLTRLSVLSPPDGGIAIGHRGSTEGSYPGYGKQGDGFVYSSIDQNGLNIISQPGSGTDDYIRFFVGQAAGAGGTPDLYIQGSGTTRGNVGINTGLPTEKLHVEGSVKIVDGTEQNGYVLTCDANGVGSWQFNSTGFSGNTSGTCITDLYITNLYGCSPVTVHDSLQHVTSSGTGVSSIAWGEGALASGDYSHAQGGSGTDLSAVFHRVTASGNYSNAQGFGVASGVGSHAEGGIDGKQIAPTSATTFSAHAEGVFTLASGEASHAEGSYTTASGPSSHAEGAGTTASSQSSHAEGRETLASGEASHAEGRETAATGFTTHAEGYLTKAFGDYSHAGGNNSRAFGNTSYAYGLNVSVSSDYSSILGGEDNTVNSNSTRSIIVGGQSNDVEGEYSFIGNGLNNSITGRGSWNTVINGESNDLSLDPSSNYNTVVGNSHSITGTSLVANSILGGQNNNIHTRGGSNPINSSIMGGTNNTVYGPDNVVIIGGEGNIIDTIPDRAVIAGGNNNNISGESDDSFIGGGDGNIINTSGFRNSITGGQNNVLSGNTSDSTIIGGDNNTILDSGSSVITGGNNNINKGDDSAIIGGQNNTILSGVQRAVILGGQNITANKNDTVLMDSLGTYKSSTMAGITVNGGNLVIADELILSSGVVTTGSVVAPGPTITGKTTWILNLTGANTSALPNANGAGQRLAVYIRAGGGGGNSMTITPATLNGYSTITLTNNGESVDLIYDFTSGWTVIGGNGFILA